MCRLVACSLVVVCVIGFARADDAKDKPAAEKVVGLWRLAASSDGIPDGVTVTVEFTKDGKMTVRFEPKEKGTDLVVLKGTFKVEKDKLDYSLDDGTGGQKQEVLTLTKLTADELVTTDPKGVKEEFKREKPADKKDD